MALLLLLLYLLCPIIELVIIIVLILNNMAHKQMNRELCRQLEEMRGETAAQPEAPQAVIAQPMAPEPAAAQPPHPSASTDSYWKQGTLPLVIGVVFIMLAGLIFATTTWNRLPDMGKVILIMAGSIIFFGASQIALKKLHIEKTAKTFYILGSLFLFVVVLSAGYFEVLGEEFTLSGRYRFFLLFVGIVLADGALLGGMKRFGDTVYAYVCLFGITLGVACFLGGFEPSQLVFTTGMAFYGILVVLLSRIGKDRWSRYCTADIGRVYPVFATVNLWGVSLLVLANMGFGVVSGIVTLSLAGVHMYIITKNERDQGSVYACSTFILIGILRISSPESVNGWLLGGAGSIIMLSVIRHSGIFPDKVKTYFKWVGIAMAAVLLLAVGTQSLAVWNVSLSSVICMGVLTLYTTILALEKKSTAMNIIWACMTAILVHYVIFLIPGMEESRILALAVVFGILFFAGQKSPCALKSRQGDMIFTCLILADVLLLLFLLLLSSMLIDTSFFGKGKDAADFVLRMAVLASGAILVLAAVSECWSRKVPVLRRGIPFVWGLLTLTPGVLMNMIFGVKIPFYVIVFVYLVLLILWDVLKRDRFRIGILSIGTVAGLGFFLRDETSLPWLFLLAGYLWVKLQQKETEDSDLDYYGICLYVLSGTYLATYHLIETPMLRILLVAVVYLIELKECSVTDKPANRNLFFRIMGSVLYVALLISYYIDDSLGLPYLGIILVCFAGIYLLCYRSRYHWLNLLITLPTLGIPLLLINRYYITGNQFYAGIMAAVLLTGIAFRYCHPIIYKTGKETRIDWYHILIILILVPVQWLCDPIWGFYYSLLLALYAIQFVTVSQLRKPAYTASALLCCIAYWNQPFLVLPDILRLEINLILPGVIILLLSRIWGKKTSVTRVQTALWLICLGALVLDAFHTQNLVDALIIEGICLVIFVLAYVVKCRRWVYMSGGIITGVTVYLTKGFWLSLSWWVYLLAVGIGLIIFAAINEKKKSDK